VAVAAAPAPPTVSRFPRRLWLALWPAALVVGLVAGAITATSEQDPGGAATAAAVLVGWAFIAAGLIIWRREPANRIGKLLTATGFTWALASLVTADHSIPFSIGLATFAVAYGFLFHVLLAYPSGKVTSRLDLAVVVIAYLDTTILRLPWVFVADFPSDRCSDCPSNAFLIADRPTLATALDAFTSAVAIAGVLYVVTRFAQRWRSASPRGRRVLAPVLVSGAVFLFALVFAILADVIWQDSLTLEWFLLIGLLAIPVSFLLGLARTKRAALGASRVVTGTATTPTPEEAQEGLRRALGDPTLQLAYRVPELGGFVDPAGEPVELVEREGRAVTEIEQEGETVAALVHDESLRSEPELVHAVVGAARISIERDLLQATVALEREFLRTIVDTSPGLFCVLDRQGHVRRHNLAWLDVVQSAERGAFWEAVAGPDLVDELRSGYERMVADATTYEHESELAMKDGSRRLFKWSATPLVGASGEVEHVVCAGLDVTELKAKADALRRERDFGRTISDTTPSLLFVIDEQGRLRRGGLNSAAEELVGRTEEDVAGERFVDLVVPADEREEIAGLLAQVDPQRPLEREGAWMGADGRELWVSWSCRPMRGEPSLFLVCGNDLTERRRTEAELQREREMLDTVGASTPSFLIVLTDDGRFAQFEPINPATERALGYSNEDVAEKDFVDLFVAPEDADAARASLAAALPEASVAAIASTWITRDGERLTVSWSATHLAYKLAGERRWLLVAGTDVTERKHYEDKLRASRVRLVEAADAERRRLGRNLHDGAQQRLVALSLTLRLLEVRLAADAEAAQQVAEIRGELGRALEELRDLARGIHPAVLTDHGLGPALKTLAERLTVPVEIRRSLEGRLPEPVEVAAYYVVSESLANVQKYAQASQVTIELARRDRHAVVQVCDDGVGGADAGGGSGLRGLADRVEALGGRLEVESESGRGTTVRAFIPAQ
jgi:PAS domain S-box-containing protein